MEMTRFFKLFLIGVVAVHVVTAAGRSILSEKTKHVDQLSQNTVHVEATTANGGGAAADAGGVKDKKNFITYGGVGGWAGVGYAAGVLPVGGLGGAAGGGGVGGLGGLGGLGGAGGGVGGGAGGVGGGVGGVGGVGGGVGGAKVLP